MSRSLYEMTDRDLLEHLMSVLDEEDQADHDAGRCDPMPGRCRFCFPTVHAPRRAQAPEGPRFKPRFVPLVEPS